MKTPEEFLAKKYTDLPGSEPVERAVCKKIHEGEKGSQTKEERVETYLERLGSIFATKRAFELLKFKILEKYVTKYDEIPENYWKSIEEEAYRRGEGGDWASITEEQKEDWREKHGKIVLNDQRASLEQWLDYFSSQESDHIPKGLKYWIFRNILNLRELIKTEVQKPDGTKEERIEFPKRSKGTVSPFPDINHEALAYVVDKVIQKLNDKGIEFEFDIQPHEREKFQEFLAKENFANLYAWANEHMNPIPERLLPVTDGKWVKYDQGSDPKELIKTIRGRGTGWCTVGENTARTQLRGGDFYVYYSLDDEGRPTMPRIAIRMRGHHEIAEDPRGIAYKQNLDPFMIPVLEKKLEEFGSVGESYKRKTADLKSFIDIENRMKMGQQLTKEDLIFLYEINAPIKGFGYREDPRIQKLREQRNAEEDARIIFLKTTEIEEKINNKITLSRDDLLYLWEINEEIKFGALHDPRIVYMRSQRNLKEDMSVIFECAENQIAFAPPEINENTKVYIGELQPNIFELIKKYNIEYVYKSVPEGKNRLENIIVGGKKTSEIERELSAAGINVTEEALEAMRVTEVLENRGKTDEEIINEIKQKLQEAGENTDKAWPWDLLLDLSKGRDFTTIEGQEKICTITLELSDLGLENYCTIDEIIKVGKELGLGLCPPEVGPYLRIKYPKLKWLERYAIVSRLIYDRFFVVGYDLMGNYLHVHQKTAKYNPKDKYEHKFVFSL
jgi:hypothetical protein